VRIPHADRAAVDVTKLEGYVLNAAHSEGRHKARVFLAALELGAGDAAWLARAIVTALPAAEATRGTLDRFGERFSADLALTHRGRAAIVRTAWIVRAGEDFPRLVTCFVRPETGGVR